MHIEWNRIRVTASLVIIAAFVIAAASAAEFAKDSGRNCDIFPAEEILDESTLGIKTLKDWHVDEVTGTMRQKLIEINVAEWWPGQDYRIPVRMIVPLERKAKSFRIIGGKPHEYLMKDTKQSDFNAKLPADGIGVWPTAASSIFQARTREWNFPLEPDVLSMRGQIL